MNYLILIAYIVAFGSLGEWMEYEMHVAFIGSIIRASGAGKRYKELQGKADALNPVRPTYNIPGQVQTAQDTAQAMAQADSPGYGRQLSEAEGAGTRFVGQASNMADSGAGLLQAASQADLNTRRNVGDINVQNQNFRANQMSEFRRALMQGAQYEDQKFDVNQMQPYLQKESDKRMFEQAAMEAKAARNDAWAGVADGVFNTALAIGGAPIGASGGSFFGKLFGGGGEASVSTEVPNTNNPLQNNDFYVPPYKPNLG